MESIVSIRNVSKTYQSGFQALKNVSLEITDGEILALLGPNGAGKTTLISIICGIVTASSGSVKANGFDIVTDYRKTRELIGLVPQELTLGAFETVWNTIRFSRGLFGKKKDNAYLEQLLKDLSLFDKKDSELRELSGGMKRRVLIAKALSHEPKILFLDEPTAGVDVELRKDMWNIVRRLRDSGVTIILTTHYIEEAEEIADRIGIISNGELLLVENKDSLMHNLGKKQLIVELKEPIATLPASLESENLVLSDNGRQITYSYDIIRSGVDEAASDSNDSATSSTDDTGITTLLQMIKSAGLELKDLHIKKSSLEDIFVDLVKQDEKNNSQIKSGPVQSEPAQSEPQQPQKKEVGA